MSNDLDTSQIKNWRSIITLVVFVLTNCPILWPFEVPIYIPRPISNTFLNTSNTLRLIPPRRDRSNHNSKNGTKAVYKPFVRLHLHMNFITAPLIAALFLLATTAIGRQEVYDGTIGNNNSGISPYDFIIVFLSLGYIANSIEASGLIRYLVSQVLKQTGAVGRRLFLYLYICFFGLGIFIGNDPIMLGFLSYMVRISTNIAHPRAWIHTQFAIANIASGLLVSSNPTNLVIAGAFNIRFINYTANMVVPVVATALFLFPFLLYIIFANEYLIPSTIMVHEMSEEEKARRPVDINIPFARGVNESEPVRLIVESILNPFLDLRSALFGAAVMVSTIIIILALNAVYLQSGGQPDYWVALPAAFVMFSWDLVFGWLYRQERRMISRNGRAQIENARVAEAHQAREEEQAREKKEEEEAQTAQGISLGPNGHNYGSSITRTVSTADQVQSWSGAGSSKDNITADDEITPAIDGTSISSPCQKHQQAPAVSILVSDNVGSVMSIISNQAHPAVGIPQVLTNKGFNDRISTDIALQQTRGRTTVLSLLQDIYRWCQVTFPTTTTALRHLPYQLVPFAFSMFVLVESLVNKGWVSVFAHGWDYWATKVGTVGSICGMGFLAVILSNVSLLLKQLT